ncbi:MAG TPA: hypothetical protein DEQ20_01595 [Desulfobulbaceae bacterium]|nr:MAG: hypothetical protein A2520_04170 [Deltaproteobacteria bacterium RIFOXYD12_FULL_53_23]HCC53611.1 hypothetical protein [Desulfobulbaceae bacterium]
MRERPISTVPKSALLLLALGLSLQIAWHATQPQRLAQAEDLPPAPSLFVLKVISLGDPIALAKALMLYLQAFDNQPGISIPFHKLDYTRVEGWLGRILELDPPGQYPLLAAGRIYGEVTVETRQRQMHNFVYQRFFDDPNRRWPWLAHVAVTTKHQLHDLPLARKYAQAIRLNATGTEVPHWAKQMEIFILEDLDELESAKVLIGGLLEGGQISDTHEIRFLERRLQEMEAKAKAR